MATFDQAGDVLHQAMALGNWAAALEELDRLDDAAEAYQQSADLLKQIGEDGLRVHVMQSLSALQLRMGRQLQALATMQAGLEDVRRPTPKQLLLKQLLKIPFRLLGR
jgi:chaperonin cofactor prefoldin